jgi:hypothetical protein
VAHYHPRVEIGALPFPTKQPPRLTEVVINRITKAIVFMKAPRCWISPEATESWLIKCKRESGHDARSHPGKGKHRADLAEQFGMRPNFRPTHWSGQPNDRG